MNSIDLKCNAVPDSKLCRNIGWVSLSTKICKQLWFLITSEETAVMKEARESKEICAVNTIERILTDGPLIHLPFFECNLESFVRS